MWKSYNEETIYAHYIGEEPILGKKYTSPFRNDGELPSLSFFIKNEELYWTDFGNIQLRKDIKDRNAISFVMQMEDISASEAIKFIADNIKNDTVTIVHKSKSSPDKVKPLIKVRTGWKPFELDYFKGIDRSLLTKRKVYPLEEYGYPNSKNLVTSKEGDPAFFYMLDKKKDSWKIYRPIGNPKDKWKSSSISSVIEGYEALPCSIIDNLIITSSTKDGMTLETYIDCCSINPASETIWKAIHANARDINARARNIYVWLDADPTGISNALKLCGLTGWKPIILPLYYKSLGLKDPFDIMRKIGGFYLRDLWHYYK